VQLVEQLTQDPDIKGSTTAAREISKREKLFIHMDVNRCQWGEHLSAVNNAQAENTKH
jgi:hypothetical protein